MFILHFLAIPYSFILHVLIYFFQIVIFLPALCRKMGVPYCIVKGKQRLGRVVHRKTATCLAITTVNSYVFVYDVTSFCIHLQTWLCFNFNYGQMTLLKRGPGWTNRSGFFFFLYIYTSYHKSNIAEFCRHLPNAGLHSLYLFNIQVPPHSQVEIFLL
jgi:hypothetical protein